MEDDRMKRCSIQKDVPTTASDGVNNPLGKAGTYTMGIAGSGGIGRPTTTDGCVIRYDLPTTSGMSAFDEWWKKPDNNPFPVDNHGLHDWCERAYLAGRASRDEEVRFLQESYGACQELLKVWGVRETRAAALEEAAKVTTSEETIDLAARNMYAKAHHTNGPKTLAHYAAKDIMDRKHEIAGFAAEAIAEAIRGLK
jgi:hypothetical protein